MPTDAGRRRLRDRALAGSLQLLSRLVQPLGWRRAQAAGAALGRAAWLVSRRDRQRALEHLGFAFPELDAAALRELARRCFAHLGTCLGEALYMMRRDCAEVAARVAVDGWEHLEAARRDGRPCVVATAHCGNWELLGALINCRGTGMRVIARRLDDAGLQRLLVGLRARFGSETIERGEPGAARALLRTLREGGVLGIMLDQDTRVDGGWVPFFGRPAHTPLVAAQLAARHGAAVLPCFIERRADGSHLLRIHPAETLPEDPIAATAQLTRRIEEQVRRRPEQWVWIHRRWRRQPAASDLAAVAPAHQEPGGAGAQQVEAERR